MDHESNKEESYRRYFFLLLGIIVASLFAYFYAKAAQHAVQTTPEYALRDWTQIWRGANALERGEDPWAPLAGPPQPYPYSDRVAYPLPALLLGRIVNHMSFPTIAFGMVFSSVFLGGIALMYRNTWHVLALVSWQFVGIARLLQWSGAMLAAARWDWAVPLVLVKPNLGLMVLAYKPTFRRFLIVGALGLLTLLVDPTWLLRWREATSGMQYYIAPVFVWQTGGPLLLLALLHWRSPEGRLLSSMALIPHNLLFYDQVLLFLVCRRGRETLILAAAGWIASRLAAHLWPIYGFAETLQLQSNYRLPVVGLVYIPALVILLLRKPPTEFIIEDPQPAGLKF